MKRIILIFAFIFVVFTTQVKAFELFYSGEKDFSFILDWTVDVNPVTGELNFYPSYHFGQSLQLYVQGEDEKGYLRGFITDHPEMLDQIFLDMDLGGLKLQWDTFYQGFLRPSWFSLEQKFSGLRLSYSTNKDEAAFLGVTGENHWREVDVIVEPSESAQVIYLEYAPVVFGSVQVWLNGEQLNYSSDFYVDTQLNILKLLIPVRRVSHLRIKYLQESEEYLIYGGRLDHHFELPNPEQQLNAGILYMQTSGEEGRFDLIGSEWFYQPTPWWWVELNAGVVKQLQNTENIVILADEANRINLEPDWRISNQFHWTNLNLTVDYQLVTNRFQDLLNLGSEGRHLRIDGLYTGEKLLVKYQQDYHWMLDGRPREREVDMEMLWIHPEWVPYLYYSQYVWEDMMKQHAIAELGYQVDLAEENGSLTYLVGIDVKNSSEDVQVMENTQPYFGVRYQKKRNQSVGARVYGERGLQLNQVVLFGDWEQGAVQWKGQAHLQSSYLQLNQMFSWNQGMNVDLNWSQSQYFTKDEGYLDLNLSLDLSPITNKEDQLWLHLIQENQGEQVSRTYSLGAEKFYADKAFYGEIGIGEWKKSLTLGMRGSKSKLNYDLSYTGSEEWETWYFGEDYLPVVDLVQKNQIAFSLGTENHFSISGDITIASNDRYLTKLDFSYPLFKDITLGIDYSGEKDFTVYHVLELRTVYHF